MADKKTIEIEYTISKKVCREAYSYIYTNKVKPLNFIWLGVILIAVYYFDHGGFAFKDGDGWYFMPLLGIPLGLLITRYYLPMHWGNRMYKQYSGKKIKWEITEQGIHYSINTAGRNVRWDYFKKAVLYKDIILMFTTGDIITPIPVDAFKEGDFELFKKWLAEYMPG